jgi:ABC-type Co2+ transport system permease subunit
MHIEPGFVSPAKVLMADTAAAGLIAWGVKEQLKTVLREPWAPLKTVAAALFFSLFMESFHANVGPSELHFVGAMAMYLTLGFVPTLLGFAVGLLLQGLVFQPTDLMHLGVNSLSLMLPLVMTHAIAGSRLFDRGLGERVGLARILKLDALYYGGVTAMVGFWLMIGDTATPFASWASFAVSYLAVVALEPVVTWGLVNGLKHLESSPLVRRLTVVGELSL